MKIHVKDIPVGGLELSEEFQPAQLDLERDDLRYTEPIELRARVAKEGNTISVKLVVETSLKLTCARCLDEYEMSFSEKFSLNIPIEDQEIIDIVDNVREEMLLSYPLQPLCSQECRGLCLTCGKNLNIEKCDCKK